MIQNIHSCQQHTCIASQFQTQATKFSVATDGKEVGRLDDSCIFLCSLISWGR